MKTFERTKSKLLSSIVLSPKGKDDSHIEQVMTKI